MILLKSKSHKKYHVDGENETVKHETKNQKRGYLGSYDDTHGCFIYNAYGFSIDKHSNSGGFLPEKGFKR